MLENIQELNTAILGRLLHYQEVLRRHGIDFPHVHSFSGTDAVLSLSDDGELD